jgi:hypothetical protein
MPETVTDPFDPPGIRLGIVRSISYGLFGKPDEFVPQARSLGAGLVRAYLYWGQVEPEPGRYTWEVVDALLDQLDGGGEVWITLCSSSPWATRQPTDFLPPSPAHDERAYGEFVRQVVRRCAGRVRYWQCDNEPSNTDLLWAGTASEYVTQLKTMYAAVKDADPAAAVVLGGCGYDVLSSDEGSAPRQFFDHVLSAGGDAFDLFDVHLYGDASRVPGHLDDARRLMRAHGCLKPIVVGEYGRPRALRVPRRRSGHVRDARHRVRRGPGDAEHRGAHGAAEPGHSRTACHDRAVRPVGRPAAEAGDVPGRLPARAGGQAAPGQLPPAGHVQPLGARGRHPPYRVLEPRTRGPRGGRPSPDDAPDVRQARLLGYEGTTLGTRHPAADTFALLAERLAGVERVTRVEVAERPSLFAFQVDRAGREPLLVLWDQRDMFDGENEPPVTVAWPWPAPTATAIDALGETPATEIRGDRLLLPVSLTPVFVTT